MALGDMSKKVNIDGQSTYNNAAARMMADKKAKDKQMEMRDMDRTKHEISHRRLEYQKVQNEIQRVRRDSIKLKTGGRDPRTLDLMRSMEAHLRTLESEGRLIDQDIRSKTLEIQRRGGISF